MSEIERLLAELCPHGVEYRALGEVGSFIRGNGLQKSDLRGDGFPAIHYGQIHTVYRTSTDTTVSFVESRLAERLRQAHPGDLVVVTTSEDDKAVAKAVAWTGVSNVAISGDACIYRHSMDPRYVAYWFQTDPFQRQKGRYVTGTKVRRISGDNLARIRIPVPPREVQQAVVEVLDTMEELEAELEAELAARRRQYAYYRDTLFSFKGGGFRWVKVSDACLRVFSGGTPLSTRAEYYGGDIPWLRTQEVNYADIVATETTITDAGLANSTAQWVRPNSVIVALSGAGVTRGRVAINLIPLTTNQHCCNLEIDKTLATPRFVYYWLARSYDDLRSCGRGNRSDLTAGIVKDYPLPLPPLREQARIVEILDSFDALVHDLSSGLPAEIAARLKQYEYYRDRLLSFEEAS